MLLSEGSFLLVIFNVGPRLVQVWHSDSTEFVTLDWMKAVVNHIESSVANECLFGSDDASSQDTAVPRQRPLLVGSSSEPLSLVGDVGGCCWLAHSLVLRRPTEPPPPTHLSPLIFLEAAGSLGGSHTHTH